MARTRSPRGDRVPLDRARIGDAALVVASRDGFDGVTMRAIAAEIGAAPMSIYRHVPGKEALVDLMFERMLSRLAPPPTERASWREVLERTARHARQHLLAHPAWLPLFARVNLPLSALGGYELLAARIAREDRVSWSTAIHALSSVIAFTLGFVLIEQAMKGKDGTPVPVEQLRLARALLGTPDARRSLPELASAARSSKRWSFDQVFDEGLRSLLRGLELAPSSPSRARHKRQAR